MPSLSRCVFRCVTRGVTIHNFPNPSKFPERFRQWVNLVGAPLAGISDAEIYEKKKVCDVHFTNEDHNSNKRLNALAVPSLCLPYISHVGYKQMEMDQPNIIPSTSKSMRPSDNTNVEVPISDGPPSHPHSPLLESLVQDVSSTSEERNVLMSTQKEPALPNHFIALTSTSSRCSDSVENMEYGASSSISNSNGSKTPLRKYELCSRTGLLRKKRAPELESDCSGVQSSPKQKKLVNERLTLSEEKMRLVQLQREILEKDLEHKTKISEMELVDKIKENKFKEEMRQKELFLMDVKIKKEQFFFSEA